MRYRYGAGALATAAEQQAETLYVIGGLYGNRQALAALLQLAARESGPVTLCFNGDFNWFNVDDAAFAAINRAVLDHDACLGNVEAELCADADAGDAGCGCAYPPSVDSGTVERSNQIHARLRRTALRHPDLLRQLAALPMLRRYRVGGIAVGVVHGDADSLAGWGFDVAALDAAETKAWIIDAFRQARVDLFASSHTCLPALREFRRDGQACAVINNGAAGMPNFRGRLSGVITRIATTAAPIAPLHGIRLGQARVDAVPLDYDAAAFGSEFLANWAPDSPAHVSYFRRITEGPEHDPERAARAPGAQ